MNKAEKRSGLSWRSAISGTATSVGAITIFALIAFTLLLVAGADPNDLFKGNLSLALTITLTFAGIVAVFLSFIWGGFVAARLAEGGFGHGFLSAFLLTLLGLGLWGVFVLTRLPQRLGIPFTPETIGLRFKEGFAPLIAIGIILMLAAKYLGASLGGIYARRRMILRQEEGFEMQGDILSAPPTKPAATSTEEQTI